MSLQGWRRERKNYGRCRPSSHPGSWALPAAVVVARKTGGTLEGLRWAALRPDGSHVTLQGGRHVSNHGQTVPPVPSTVETAWLPPPPPPNPNSTGAVATDANLLPDVAAAPRLCHRLRRCRTLRRSTSCGRTVLSHSLTGDGSGCGGRGSRAPVTHPSRSAW
jgi:hypothetical protein